MYSCTQYFLLILNMWAAASSSCCCDFPATKDCKALPPLAFVRVFVTAVEQKLPVLPLSTKQSTLALSLAFGVYKTISVCSSSCPWTHICLPLLPQPWEFRYKPPQLIPREIIIHLSFYVCGILRLLFCCLRQGFFVWSWLSWSSL